MAKEHLLAAESSTEPFPPWPPLPGDPFAQIYAKIVLQEAKMQP